MSKGPRNLTYEMEEPAFLRRLRQQHSGGSGPERYIAPRNKKRPTDEDDDAPTYVLDEGSGETLSRQEFEAMNNGEVVGGKEGGEKGIKIPREKEPAAEKENITEIGGKGRRRKVAKVVGDGDDDDTVVRKDENGDKRNGKEETEKKKKGRAGGKAKKAVKLSFDHDE
ncbi:hypothetical protein C7212DRAFT_341732 [Tuber magnatum]|uniref:DUF4604 domain-containing protein n=1 Tax=Tuber magnatum TaxID=42249 RepID=A0A317SYF7_9PEZI|nr:hypothetical protein C7212DRAFT_341732 [Tuber magnatum]